MEIKVEHDIQFMLWCKIHFCYSTCKV